MAINIKVLGLEEAMRNMSSLAAAVPKEFAAGLYQEAELIMTDSKLQIPVDTGAARSSGFVNPPEISLGGISVTLGYGGVAAQTNPKTGVLTSTYLEPLHEDMSATHTVGKAKFLEDPVKAHAKTLEANLTKRVEQIVRRHTLSGGKTG